MALETKPKPPGSKSRARSAILYRCILILVAIAIATLATQSALVRFFARADPQLALRISPRDAQASSVAAGTALLKMPDQPRQAPVARAYALRALRRDMTRNDSLVILAATLVGPDAQRHGLAMVRQAEILSRRNLATELWLIEDSVNKGNVAGALHQFDIALRTSDAASGLLFPVLRNAVDDPQLTVAIARTLNGAPWRDQFLQYAVSLNRPSIPLAVVVALQGSLVPYQGTDLKGALIAQLVAAKRYETAARLALGRSAGLVQDTDFSREGGYPPFAWTLADGAGLVARRLREQTTSQLQILADEGRSGVVATQLIHAASGRYMLSGSLASSVPGLALQVACADDERIIATLPLVGKRAVVITIPDNCAYQKLSVIVPATLEGAHEWRLERVDLIPD